MGGLVGKRYPWGDEIDKAKAHYDRWNDGKGTTKAVGNYAENGYGLYEMVGNVWEWCVSTVLMDTITVGARRRIHWLVMSVLRN